MQYLGDYVIAKESFPTLEVALKELTSALFKRLPELQRLEKVCQTLLRLIEEAPSNTFLLIPVLDFIEKIEQKKILDHFHFNQFEFWLNQFSGLSPMDHSRIRGKIVGRWVPRDEYQRIFPIGLGKMYPGSHFVTAHSSPDLDTTVASFWGWVDAFAARVSEGLHIWNIPGGLPPAQAEVTFLFYNIFGSSIFSHLAKHRTSLAISGLDLVSQNGVVKKELHHSTFDIDHENGSHAVVLVDAQGFYVGEWRTTDVDRVRSVLNLLNQCLRWYENSLHVRLISVFAVQRLTSQELKAFFDSILKKKIEECEPVSEFSPKQKKLLDHYLRQVLGVTEGLQSSFATFAHTMAHHSLFQFQGFVSLIDTPPLFDAEGKLIEDRPQLFGYLAKVIGALENAIYSVRLHVDKLDVALRVKTDVLGLLPHPMNYRADLEELRSKIDHFPYLTLTASDGEGRPYPLGVVHATDLFKPVLGTVTLRDFSNREETKVPSYLDVISILDHHKSQLVSSAPTVAWITDAQSCNTLVAELGFQITDQYSTGGMTLSQIEKQIEELKKELTTPAQIRVLQRLLQKHLAAQRKEIYFVAPEREIVEYLQCLYAIFDDTDLLSKVSVRDVECVASLVNRLKSLMMKKEVEVLHFDDIVRDERFAKKAASRILQNDDVYSLYSKVYLAKEKGVEENLKLAAAGRPSTIFSDTKEQNGCCRVGQTKVFGKNFPTFAAVADKLRHEWLRHARQVQDNKKEIDFFLHMISTVAGAEALYAGKEGTYSHLDEIWLWIPSTESGIEHLKSFLSGFRSLPQLKLSCEVEFLGDNAKELKQIFDESFISVSTKVSAQDLPIAVLRFPAGALNSRKAQITPYLPRLS